MMWERRLKHDSWIYLLEFQKSCKRKERGNERKIAIREEIEENRSRQTGKGANRNKTKKTKNEMRQTEQNQKRRARKR